MPFRRHVRFPSGEHWQRREATRHAGRWACDSEAHQYPFCRKRNPLFETEVPYSEGKSLMSRRLHSPEGLQEKEDLHTLRTSTLHTPCMVDGELGRMA